MARRGWPAAFLLLVSLFLGACAAHLQPDAGGSALPASGPLRTPTSQILEAYGRIPLHFEENRGQAAEAVRFLARTPSGVIALEPQGLVLPVEGAPVTLRFAGADASPTMHALEPLPGRINYYLGRDPSQWRTGVPTFARVRYDAVYPGIDVVVYGNQQRLEYDFVVAAGADPSRIRLRVDGAEALELDADGAVRIRRGERTVVQHAPVIYQERDGRREPVEGRYVVRGREIAFALGAYDRTRPLIIDPVVAYSTRVGRGQAGGIAVDATGHAYITGAAGPDHYPVVNGNPHTVIPKLDIFVTKLTPAGDFLVFSTFLGSGGPDQSTGIAVDSAGNAWISGVAGPDSANGFPTTSDALVPSAPSHGSEGRAALAFKVSATGALLYSTYLQGTAAGTGGVSGSCFDGTAHGVAVDGANNAYVVGHTSTTNFPTTVGAYQPAPAPSDPHDSCPHAKAFVVKFTSANAVSYSTYLDGTADDLATAVAVDAGGTAYVTGSSRSTGGAGGPEHAPFPITTNLTTTSTDSFGWVAKLDTAGVPVWTTMIGPVAHAVALGADGTAYVTGTMPWYFADNFTPVNAFQSTRHGSDEGFAARLNATGTAYVWATYLGGVGEDRLHGIAVDAEGNAWVVGTSGSPDFPTQDPTQGMTPETGPAIVTAKLSATGALLFGTHLGAGHGDAVAIDAAGGVYLTGEAGSDFVATAGAYKTTPSGGGPDVFVLKYGTLAGGGPQNVVWTTPVKVAVSGNTITKNAGCNGCADAGAVSQQTVASGDGGAQFAVSAGFAGTVGLSTGNPGTSGGEIKFGLKFFSGYVEVRESGTWKASWPIAGGDLHKVAVEGGVVKYSLNGTLKFTSAVAPTFPLLVDASLNTVGTAVQNAVMLGGSGGTFDKIAPTVAITSPANGATVSGVVTVTMSATDNVGVAGVKLEADGVYVGAEDTTAPYTATWDTTSLHPGTHILRAVARDTAGNVTVSARVTVQVATSSPPPSGGNVVWTSPVKVAVSGNTITKNAGCSGCADAGAISQQTIASGNGGVQFTVSTGATGTVGLSTGNPGTSGSEIKFGLRFFSGYVEVRESGAWKASWPIAAGDVHKVAVEGGVVKYSQNGTVKYTSTVAPSYPLLVDTSLNALGSAVQNAVLSTTP